MVRGRMRRLQFCTLLVLAALTAGCGGTGPLLGHTNTANAGPGATATVTVTAPSSTAPSSTTPGARSPADLGFPADATKNTTRIPGTDAIENAAAVALSVFPSAAAGTHPTAVTLAPTDDWQAALAASSLMADPFRAPILLSGPGTLPPATSEALSQLAPTGNSQLGGAQALAIGDAPLPNGLHTKQITAGGPAPLAAAIDAFEARVRGHESVNVVVASLDSPSYAMPAAGYAAESGSPILFVHNGSVPPATAQQLSLHHHPHIYVLGPSSVISDTVLSELSRFGPVKRVGADDPAANSVAFTTYRDPACPTGQPCAHIPHSFGWAIRSPGHAYVLIPAADPLEAAAASALSSSGGYGPQLLIEDPNTLPKPVLNYFLDYATPGYTQEGPTAAVYNHGWLIGNRSAISLAVQAQVDSLLEVVPQR
jgi:hypothetical protein